MSGCSLISPELPAQVSGQSPIFQYDKNHTSDYFGVQVNYLQSTTTCYGQNSVPTFTPIIQNFESNYTRTCQFSSSASYTSILCTDAPVNAIPDGHLTISFRGYTGDANTAPIPFTASFGPSPAVERATITATVTSPAGGSNSTANEGFAATVTAPGGPSSTETVYAGNNTVTETNVVGGTTALTSTVTSTVSSCSNGSVSTTSSSAAFAAFFNSTSIQGTAVSTTAPSSTNSTLAIGTPSSFSSAATPTADSVSCNGNADDGKTFSTPAGDFIIECGIDRYDNNLGSNDPIYGPKTFAQCIQACAANSQCVDVSWDGVCYLKSGIGAPNPNSNVWGARLASVPTSTPTSSIPQTVTVTTTISNTAYGCQCTALPKITNPQCPINNNAIYTSSCGAQYVIECGSDRWGNDLPDSPSQQSSLAACIEDCDNTTGCVDVSWVINGLCYKKGTIDDIRQNANIWGARQIAGCSQSSSLSKLKLHRKRVARNEPDFKGKVPTIKLHHFDMRQNGLNGTAAGPDETYTTSTTTVTQTDTVTPTAGTPSGTTTVAGAQSGIATSTAYITWTTTVDSTSYTTSTATITTAITACLNQTARV